MISVLAALSLAGGMALPNAQAEAQGSSGGYTYTERVCQEYGQQPRRYNVRDPIPGSDWRSDGGWAIVLERSSGTITRYRLNATGYYLGSQVGFEYHIDDPANGVEKIRLTGHNGGFAFRRYDRMARAFHHNIIIYDTNGDGDLTTADIVYLPGDPRELYRRGTFDSWPEAYGASYIRWANMAWCR